ncbi:MAG TPA: DNA-protecting protein DprA [Nitrosomonas sp.]|uniref:DNA-processing protein DprA n=1 Tax=Nitrosomonas sp. TaxID=42353 RepID=UPI000E96EB21|nr:DNA-processing protein DprA [Nitrosomonas sp.]GJL75271.1 MAG: DNA processing protein DprA [Nitrosomonas sp.]HBV21455.1 DNA-protecting protein DprA [Nitrosomonas sp.]
MKHAADIESWLQLCLIKGVGDESIRRLLVAFGTPAAVLTAPVAMLERIVGKSIAKHLKLNADPDRINVTLDWLRDPVNSIITLADSDYPSQLLNIPDPPPLLYLKGRRELMDAPALAVVGSRNATPQGLSNAEAFAESISNAGICIISGMALGIDAAAHHGGLRGSSASIAVVGTGLDIVYPARNHQLAHKLAKEGALISELPLGMPAIGRNFPRRNRIISGMSQGCLVVEAALRSGSLITARQALEQGREVFAMPGSIHSPLSKGCHALIKEGAKLVESTQDILDELNYSVVQKKPSTSEPVDHELSNENTWLLRCLGHDVVDVDTLCVRSGLTVESVSAMLLTLELDGQIASLPGGCYQKITK